MVSGQKRTVRRLSIGLGALAVVGAVSALTFVRKDGADLKVRFVGQPRGSSERAATFPRVTESLADRLDFVGYDQTRGTVHVAAVNGSMALLSWSGMEVSFLDLGTGRTTARRYVGTLTEKTMSAYLDPTGSVAVWAIDETVTVVTKNNVRKFPCPGIGVAVSMALNDALDTALVLGPQRERTEMGESGDDIACLISLADDRVIERRRSEERGRLRTKRNQAIFDRFSVPEIASWSPESDGSFVSDSGDQMLRQPPDEPSGSDGGYQLVNRAAGKVLVDDLFQPLGVGNRVVARQGADWAVFEADTGQRLATIDDGTAQPRPPTVDPCTLGLVTPSVSSRTSDGEVTGKDGTTYRPDDGGLRVATRDGERVIATGEARVAIVLAAHPTQPLVAVQLFAPQGSSYPGDSVAIVDVVDGSIRRLISRYARAGAWSGDGGLLALLTDEGMERYTSEQVDGLRGEVSNETQSGSVTILGAHFDQLTPTASGFVAANRSGMRAVIEGAQVTYELASNEPVGAFWPLDNGLVVQTETRGSVTITDEPASEVIASPVVRVNNKCASPKHLAFLDNEGAKVIDTTDGSATATAIPDFSETRAENARLSLTDDGTLMIVEGPVVSQVRAGALASTTLNESESDDERIYDRGRVSPSGELVAVPIPRERVAIYSLATGARIAVLDSPFGMKPTEIEWTPDGLVLDVSSGTRHWYFAVPS